MKATAILILPLAMMLFLSVQCMPSSGIRPAMMKMCCSFGNRTADTGNCFGKPILPKTHPAEKPACEQAWLSCCLQQQQNKRCNKGVENAVKMKKCSSKVSAASECGRMETTCCTQCNIGFEFALSGASCQNAGSGDDVYDVISKHCCKAMTQNSALKIQYARARVVQSSNLTAACASRQCSHGCLETAAGPACICPTGYTILTDGVSCTDIDECKNSSICSLFNTCFNTVGSYYCSRKQKCGPGYELSGANCVDIDECSRRQGICGNGNCLNQDGTYFCRCFSGYKLNAATKRCEDFNACDLKHCEYDCQNLGRGMYQCKCPQGKVLNNDRKTCRVFDPCERSRCQHKCKAVDQTRYSCTCSKGYQVDRDGFSCTINSYTVNIEIKNVDPMVSYNLKWKEENQNRIINIPTSTTVTRNLVFKSAKQLDSLVFKLYDMRGRLMSINNRQEFVIKPIVGNLDVKLQVGTNDNNPCRTSPCHQNCENAGGGRYRCTCRSGYEMDRDGKCQVIRDPCKNRPCQHRCYNKGAGQYYCTCPSGQKLNKDQRTCKVTDLCQLKRCQWRCRHDGVRATCICPSGYQLSGDSCRDIDECSRNPGRCEGGSTCVNTYGGYKCAPSSCPKSYLTKSGDSYCYKQQCPRGNTECLNDKIFAHQWLYSKVANGIQPDGISYYYSVYKPSYNHQIYYSIASGNRDNAFYLVKDNDYRVTIKNRKKLVGPKDYAIKLLVSIYKDGRLESQLVSTFYIYVSPYNFY